MKLIFLLFAACVLTEISIYSLTSDGADGTTIHFNSYQNKRIVLVNIATNSPQAAQIAELQQLYLQNKSNLVVVAFPSNDFGNEPRTNAEIADYLQTTYGVTFPIVAKGSVADTLNSIQPVYNWLANKAQNGVFNSKVKSDFYKYLINRQGKIVGIFDSSTSVLSTTFQNALQIHN